MYIFLYLFIYLFNVCSIHPSPSPTPTPRRSFVTRSDVYFNFTNYNVELNYGILSQICVFCFAIIAMLWLMFLHFCNNVTYVCFATNLSLFTKKLPRSPRNVFSIFLSFLLLLLELEENQVILLSIYWNLNFRSLINFLNSVNCITPYFYYCMSLYFFSCHYSCWFYFKPCCFSNLDLFTKQKSILLGAAVTHSNAK